ncbi:hypothetical protein [Paenibacillus donghaensis]|uniref:Uncharacterized protein n=1 Tax=Paenibacillus donghaensis TaxID=414771 RepID=A0A2Z2KGV3_9BACL|nr:hypothetical protein [Paenibacillus donghaensis]ASA22400.1 hypothetical protein B9T62_17360 [Paenibacillus donghaensis]
MRNKEQKGGAFIQVIKNPEFLAEYLSEDHLQEDVFAPQLEEMLSVASDAYTYQRTGIFEYNDDINTEFYNELEARGYKFEAIDIESISFLFIRKVKKILNESPIFEIKYELFEDDVEELKTIDVPTFDKEWHQIYGLFTIVIDGQELFPYPTQNMPLSAKKTYSELILTHFKLLVDVYNTLKSSDYVALKYVENPWTWLEIQADNDNLVLNELKYEIVPLESLICTDKFLLKDAPYDSFSNVKIHKNDFFSEIRNKIINFVLDIQAINSEILASAYFSSVLNFYNIHK